MPHPHGTINRYNNQRYRCDQCRTAIRDYRRAQRARIRTIEQSMSAALSRAAALDAQTAAKLTIGGHAIWACGHINRWPGVDVIRALYRGQTDVSRYRCPQCKAIGILGTADPWERPEIPRAPGECDRRGPTGEVTNSLQGNPAVSSGEKWEVPLFCKNPCDRVAEWR